MNECFAKIIAANEKIIDDTPKTMSISVQQLEWSWYWYSLKRMDFNNLFFQYTIKSK